MFGKSSLSLVAFYSLIKALELSTLGPNIYTAAGTSRCDACPYDLLA